MAEKDHNDAVQMHARLGNALNMVLHALRQGDTARATDKAAQALAAYRALNMLEAV